MSGTLTEKLLTYALEVHMKSFRWIAAASLVIAAASFIIRIHAQSSAPDITGYYNEKDGEYVKISKNGENVYQYLQHLKAGDWIGVAIRDGDRLSIGWSRSDGRNLGVSIYRIEKGDKGPTLTGEWSPYPGGGTMKETLTWARKVD